MRSAGSIPAGTPHDLLTATIAAARAAIVATRIAAESAAASPLDPC